MRTYPFGPANRLEIDPTYAWLREHEPLARVRLPYGEAGWLVTRYDDVRTVLSDPRFSLAEAALRDVPRLVPKRMGAILTDLDPPQHTRLRRLIAKAFTARRVERLRDRAGQIAGELADDMIKAGPPADLVAAFAVPLPGLMICDLLGVPYANRERFQDLVAAFISITALSPERRQARIGELVAYIAELATKRREHPTDDLIGALVVAHEEHDRLTEDEAVQLTLLLLAGGYETTASEIANFTYTLLTHPDQLAMLRARPELIPNAVEELLRWVPLARYGDSLPRYAKEDVELSGGTVAGGEAVLFFRPAANRDPRAFADPDRLDLTREFPGHVAFGHGAHHCIGAPLARMDLQIALTTLLDRFPNLHLASDDIEWKTGMVVRGPVALPVGW